MATGQGLDYSSSDSGVSIKEVDKLLGVKSEVAKIVKADSIASSEDLKNKQDTANLFTGDISSYSQGTEKYPSVTSVKSYVETVSKTINDSISSINEKIEGIGDSEELNRKFEEKVDKTSVITDTTLNSSHPNTDIPSISAIKEYIRVNAPSGQRGYQGYQGAPGAKGDTGAQGTKGETGTAGARGYQGYQGVTGKDGSGVNIKGTKPSTGELPSTGVIGDAYLVNGTLYVWVGSGGDTQSGKWQSAGNIQGPRGYQGYQGKIGATGPTGGTGSKGDRGYQGYQGVKGADSSVAGPRGYQGYQGKTGAGSQGARGYQGYQGTPGAKGDTGNTGPTGNSHLSAITMSGNNTNFPGGGSFKSNVSITGSCSASSGFYQDSDIRLKDNLRPISDMDLLRRVKSINLCEFNWKSDGRHDFGVSAQDAESILPELVEEDPNTGMKKVNYTKLLLLRIAALENNII